MLITFFKKTNQKTLYSDLTEAEMDGPLVWLHDFKNGICSVGQTTCYAFIIKNSVDCALLHVSSLGYDGEEISGAIEYLKSNYPNEPIEIILARSHASYDEDQKEMLTHCQEEPTKEEMQPSSEYFQEMDQKYCNFFIEEFNICPIIIDIPHHFLIIDSSNTLCLLEKESPGDIDYTETSTKSIEIKEDTLGLGDSYSRGIGFFNDYIASIVMDDDSMDDFDDQPQRFMER